MIRNLQEGPNSVNVQETAFTLDNMGRFLCNTLQEARDSVGVQVAGKQRDFDTIARTSPELTAPSPVRGSVISTESIAGSAATPEIVLRKCRRVFSIAPPLSYRCQEYVHLIAKRVSRTWGGFDGAMLANCVPTL